MRYVPVKDEKHGVMMRIAFIFLGISWLIVPHSLQAEQTGRDQKVTDRAAFAAAQEGSVIVLGHTYSETVTALYSWALGSRSESVALAPLSAVLLREDSVQQ